jgi:hypothetical protein
MIDYWNARRGDGAPPARAAIDPSEFADIITQAFVIGRARTGVYPFRLAGSLLEDLHRRSLLPDDFLGLWAISDRPKVGVAIESALHAGEAVVAHAVGRTARGHQAKLEIFLAPLAGPAGQVDRLLGLYQPVSPLFRLQSESIERLFLSDIAFADAERTVPSPLRIASVDGRRIA